MTRRGMLTALSAMLPLAVADDGSVDHRRAVRERVFGPVTVKPPEPARREMSDEERAQLKTDRKARRADRMRLRKRRGFR